MTFPHESLEFVDKQPQRRSVVKWDAGEVFLLRAVGEGRRVCWIPEEKSLPEGNANPGWGFSGGAIFNALEDQVALEVASRLSSTSLAITETPLDGIPNLLEQSWRFIATLRGVVRWV